MTAIPTLTGLNLIGSRRTEGGRTNYSAINPVNGQALLPLFQEASATAVDAAVHYAEKAFETYRAMTPEKRASFLEAIALKIEAMGDALLERAEQETALQRARLAGERARTMGQLRLYAGMLREGSWVMARIDHADPARQPVPKPDLRKMMIPLGPVVVFGASNFPFAYSTAGGDTASALGAGCPVIYKAHPAHPGTCELVARAILDAADQTGMPDGVFSMLHGVSAEVGQALVKHPLIQAVGFTGSQRGGRALFDAAAARPSPIPVYAEMGSVNPVFVLPGALKERGETIAKGLAGSVTLGVGQFCTNPGLVLGMSGQGLEQLIEIAGGQIGKTPVGTMLTPAMSQAFHAGVEKQRHASGVQLVAQARAAENPPAAPGAPTMLVTDAMTFLVNDSLRHEVFGPSTLVISCATIEELERAAERIDGQLTASIHTGPEDEGKFDRLIAILQRKAGRLIFNGFPTGVEVCSAMEHGGPYPASTDSRTTSVGHDAIYRFVRPVAYQNFPAALLPAELQDGNPRKILRFVDNQWTRE